MDHLADVLAGNLLLIWFNEQLNFTYIYIQCGLQEFGDQRRVSDHSAERNRLVPLN